MHLPDLWRTTPFRLSLLHGVTFAAALLLTMGAVYIQVGAFMTQMLDHVISDEAQGLIEGDPELLEARVSILGQNRGAGYYGLYDPTGTQRLAGNLDWHPVGQSMGARPQDLPPAERSPASRAIVTQVADGRILLVGRDPRILRGMQGIILNTLMVAALLVIFFAAVLAWLLARLPLKRIAAVRAAAGEALAGGRGIRIPVAGRGDEIDALAALANSMLDDSERLLEDVKGVADQLAHDLRTPLTRIRLNLYRALHEAREGLVEAQVVERALADIEILLRRFRAILRIGEIERRARYAGFGDVDLRGLLGQMQDLYGPVAEERCMHLKLETCGPLVIHADRELLAEAIGNLVENAFKYGPSGGIVTMRLAVTDGRVLIEVTDEGPGIPLQMQQRVMRRFERLGTIPGVDGTGVGLSIVLAIVRLHGMSLKLEDARPGLRAVISLAMPSPGNLGYETH
ncbi:TPA: sensor histidine kinase [Stenotrophomonas maltophilia]|uniref:sensor histidine kinase n=1 Tax=Stenotrophomonas maltophilia TaxID=40324 RepID=UPI00130FDD92|nr:MULTISPECIES: HAMP domain-containing sensor histidine kinase [Stenotrophomonas]MCO7496898.1 HAMP domain-containing histidine kinase [Stenotrophomonas maltophilia]